MADVTQGELAAFYGVDYRTIPQWVKRGCPIKSKGGRGKSHTFDSVAVARWREEQIAAALAGDQETQDAEELKRRKLAGETTLIEIDVLKARGEVVLIDDVVREYTDAVLACKAHLRNIPLRVAPLVVGETDETRIKDVILSEIDSALDELANSRFVDISRDAEE